MRLGALRINGSQANAQAPKNTSVVLTGLKANAAGRTKKIELLQ
jgi:hypothetical protein